MATGTCRDMPVQRSSPTTSFLHENSLASLGFNVQRAENRRQPASVNIRLNKIISRLNLTFSFFCSVKLSTDGMYLQQHETLPSS